MPRHSHDTPCTFWLPFPHVAEIASGRHALGGDRAPGRSRLRWATVVMSQTEALIWDYLCSLLIRFARLLSILVFSELSVFSLPEFCGHEL